MGYRLNAALGVVFMLLVSNCTNPRSREDGGKLSKTQALELATDLANAECKEKFQVEPFDSTSYPIVFEKGRWRWGQIDPHGIGGYSAVVTFRADGSYPQVEVAFSTDSMFRP